MHQPRLRREMNFSGRRAAKESEGVECRIKTITARGPRASQRPFHAGLIKTARSELKFIVDFAARESISGNLIIADATLRNLSERSKTEPPH